MQISFAQQSTKAKKKIFCGYSYLFLWYVDSLIWLFYVIRQIQIQTNQEVERVHSQVS